MPPVVAAQPQTEHGGGGMPPVVAPQAAAALGGGGGGGGAGLAHARPHTHDRPDLGEGFHDVLNGLSYDCPGCGCTKHLSTRQLGERTAANRLRAWGEACSANPHQHRLSGKRLLSDFSFAD